MFTLDQKKAHDVTRHIAITANAGSGKTRVLVSRYCDIIQYWNVWPEDVAAVTFTEKAASELRSKIAREFEERLNDPEQQPSWDRLKEARERFTSAVVTTIHGFCSQMLREFPIESDVQPNYGVMSGYERTQALEDALMEAIEVALREPEAEGELYSAAYLVARRIGREKMEQIVRGMLYNRETIEYSRTYGVLKLEREETLALWQRWVDDVTRNTLFGANVRAAIESLIEQMNEKSSANAEDQFDAARRATSANEMIPAMIELRKIIMTTSGKPRQNSYRLPKDDLDMLDPWIDTVNDAFSRAEPLFNITIDPEIHQVLYDNSSVLLELYKDAAARYNARKERLNVLDFDDLQLRLLEALEKPEARARITGRFRFLMIDEFQDTNELQYAIAYELLEKLGRGNLCIVGDRKQSIYGFRNAEVRVFNTASNDIVEVNRLRGVTEMPMKFKREDVGFTSTEEDLGVVKLTASFRLLPSICAYANQACAPVMKTSGEFDFGVEYEPLVCARRSEGAGNVEFILARPQPKKNAEDQGDEEPAPELLASEPKSGESTPWCSEAEMIARRLVQIIGSSEPVVWEQDEDGIEQARPARFADVAVLCRKRSTFTDIEEAFRHHGIPFVTHGGSGFYDTQEILDTANYLRTLLSSRDDMALLGILRSPYFCVSDTELYRLAQMEINNDESNLWTRAVNRVEQGLAEPALVRAVRAITDDRSMASRIPVSLLIRRAIERTGWRGAVIGSQRGEQRLVNIEKLLELAREFEQRGFTNLFDFVERLTELIEASEMESEAPINTGRDAVRLMTMHGAKGLEFPIVVLPSLHEKVGRPSSHYFDKELGFGWNWTFNKEEFRPGVVALMAMREADRNRAEEARLFYVAITRARDMLIIAGEYDADKPPRNVMLAWALGPIGEPPENNAAVQVTSHELRFLNSDLESEWVEEWEQTIEVYRKVDETEVTIEEESKIRAFPTELVRIGELPARAEGEVYSASQLLVYAQCPTKYYLKYRLGIPEDLNAAYNIDPSSRDSEDGTLFARLFRMAATRIDASAEVAALGNEQILPTETASSTTPKPMAAIIDEVLLLEPLTDEQRTAARQRLAQTFEAIFNSQEARAVLFPPNTTAFVEHELRLPFQKQSSPQMEFVMGVVDRMLVAADGTISIVHYKTRRLAAADLPQAAEGYLPQIRLYTYLISSLNPEQASVRTTLLFTEHPTLPQSFTFTKFDMLRIEEEIRTAITDIHQITYSGRRELPLKTPHCPVCPFFVGGGCLLGN